ncbi:MAG: methyltransferase [Bacteriovoracaceae bacterium]|nr:methyltransferase [Bacteriovoracaceae bacterium]
MDYKRRFDNIVSFLTPITELWENEVLYQYPDLNAYPNDWMNWLSKLSDSELWTIDCRKDTHLLSNSPMSLFSQSIDDLIELPREDLHPDDLPSWAWNYVKNKKRHEINQIRGVLTNQTQSESLNIVDIGGGVGQLGRILSLYHGLPVTSIDQDAKLQEIGKQRLTKYPKPEGYAELKFIESIFDSEVLENNPQLQKVCNESSLILGLHTCGPLAIDHLKVGLKTKSSSLFNFACCYNKLSQTDTNLSDYSKQNGLILNKFALTLATRGHADMTFEDYLFKKRVKKFRYTLQLLATHFKIDKNLESVGSATPRTYKGDFTEYVLSKLEFAKINHNLTREQIAEFYNRKDITESVETMFLANLIRWQLGRVLELYILLDRVLWLEEKGHKPTLKQYFDEDLSPRNIGLFLSK